MADFIRSLRDAVLTIIDGDSPANEVEVEVAEGNLSIKTSKQVLEIMDRGDLHEVKRGDEVPVEWSFSARFHGFEKPTGPGVIEALNRTGAASAHVTTRPTSDVFMSNMQWELKGVGGSVDETVTLSDCYLLNQEVQEGDPNVVTLSGRAWVTYPTIS